MNVLRLFTSTSRRTFVLTPLVVAAEQLLTRRTLHPAWAALMVAGYLQYRLVGDYRTRLGGGGPGQGTPPERIVRTGIYAWSRNPMYVGHLLFLAGLTLTTRSPLAGAILALNLPWFARHVRRDEARLRELFGQEYDAYRREVPRWLPRPA